MTMLTQPASRVNEAPNFCSPYMLGALDAEENLPCVPENYYAWEGQIAEYCEGYQSIAGETLTTRQILGKPNILTDAEIAAELEDYADHDDYARYGIERSIQ